MSERELVLALGRALPADWALSHDAAALALGLPLPARRPPGGGAIEITPHASGPAATRPKWSGCVFHQRMLTEEDVTLVEGTRVTALARTFADLAETLPMLDLIAVADVAMRRGATPKRLAAQAERVRRGAVRFRRAWELADGRAETAQESRCRLLIVTAGLPVPATQVDCHDDDGHFLGRVDMLIGPHRTVIEHLGRDHFDEGRTAADYDPGRRLRFHRAGFEYVELTAATVLRQPLEGLMRVRDALTAQGWVGQVDVPAVHALLEEERRMTARRAALARRTPRMIIGLP